MSGRFTPVPFDSVPDGLFQMGLKPALSWLYYESYGEYPMVLSGLSDRFLEAYAKRYAGEASSPEKTSEALVGNACTAGSLFPSTMSGMFEESAMGMGYTLFRSPVCFFIPYVLFADGGSGQRSFAPWFAVYVPRFVARLKPYWEEDKKLPLWQEYAGGAM